MKKLSFLALVIFLNGCTIYSLVEPGKIDAGGEYTVSTSLKWSKIENQHLQSLTLDGPGLQFIHISSGVSEGKRLFGSYGKDGQPPYEKELSLPEMQEFVQNSLIATGAEQVEFTEVTPTSFGKWPGLRLEFSFYRKSGLQKRGLIVAAQNEGKFYHITYFAPALYFYDKNIADVEELINSITIIDKS